MTRGLIRLRIVEGEMSAGCPVIIIINLSATHKKSIPQAIYM